MVEPHPLRGPHSQCEPNQLANRQLVMIDQVRNQDRWEEQPSGVRAVKRERPHAALAHQGHAQRRNLDAQQRHELKHRVRDQEQASSKELRVGVASLDHSLHLRRHSLWVGHRICGTFLLRPNFLRNKSGYQAGQDEQPRLAQRFPDNAFRPKPVQRNEREDYVAEGKRDRVQSELGPDHRRGEVPSFRQRQ